MRVISARFKQTPTSLLRAASTSITPLTAGKNTHIGAISLLKYVFFYDFMNLELNRALNHHFFLPCSKQKRVQPGPL